MITVFLGIILLSPPAIVMILNEMICVRCSVFTSPCHVSRVTMLTHGYKSNVSEVAGIDPDDSVIENENKCGVNEVICYILYFQALYTT